MEPELSLLDVEVLDDADESLELVDEVVLADDEADDFDPPRLSVL